MIQFIEYQFSVPPEYLVALKADMLQFNWMNEYISFTESGIITLFDIKDGELVGAVKDTLKSFEDMDKKRISLNIVAFESGLLIRLFMDEGELKQAYADSINWNPLSLA